MIGLALILGATHSANADASSIKTDIVVAVVPQIVDGKYQIETLAHLRWLSETHSAWEADYEQTADIDASETVIWNNGRGLEAIGEELAGSFSVTYNGNGHVIYGLQINRGDCKYVGILVGHSLNSTITNCFAAGNAVSTAWMAGTQIGTSNETYIKNVYAVGSATSTKNFAGGIIGSYTSKADAPAKYAISNAYAVSYVNVLDTVESAFAGLLGGVIGRIEYSTASQLYWNIALRNQSIGTSVESVSKLVNGKSAAEMTEPEFADSLNGVSNSIGSGAFTAVDGFYPILTVFADNPIAKASALPIFFATGDNPGNVTTDFTLGVFDDVSWTSSGTTLLAIKGTKTIVKESGSVPLLLLY